MRLSTGQVEAELRVARGAYNRGDVATANRLISSVLKSNPDSSGAHFGLGMIRVTQGQQSEALASFMQALRIDPKSSEALAWATLTSLNLRQGEQAEELARRLLNIQPKNDRVFFLLSNALTLQGRLEEALDSVENALSIQPTEPDYVIGKAQLLRWLHWSSQAIEWYRRAIKLRPSPELSVELADSLLRESQVQEALHELEQILPHMPVETRPNQLLAQAYTEAQNFDAAAAYWNSAESLTSDRKGLILARVMSEINAGRLDVAEVLLRETLEEYPSASQFYSPLTTIVKVKKDDWPLVESMKRLLAEGDLELSRKRDLCYSLAKAYDDLGEYHDAIVHYDDANRLAYELSPICKKFDAHAWSKYTDLHIEFFTKKRIESLAREGLQTTTPIFIMGMIRSGTTLTEHILSRHSKVEAGGEKTFWPDHRGDVFDVRSKSFNSAAGKHLGQAFVNALTGRESSAPYVTEKNPSNVMIAALIHCVFPHAKLLHVMRHAVDNLLSIWMTPIQSGLPFVYNRDHLLYAYKDYLRLVDHLRQVLPEHQFQTFEYEALTSDPCSTIKGMLSFLDLESEPSCYRPEDNLRTVRTPSVYQVRQPINTNSQAKWKRYEPWLGRFAELLGDGSPN